MKKTVKIIFCTLAAVATSAYTMDDLRRVHQQLQNPTALQIPNPDIKTVAPALSFERMKRIARFEKIEAERMEKWRTEKSGRKLQGNKSRRKLFADE